MTNETKTEEQQEDLLAQAKPEQAVATIDQTPRPSEREPAPVAQFSAGGPLAAMIPQTPEEYARMAKLLIDAKCVPASYEGTNAQETRAKLIIGLMKSVEIGVPPITGLNGIMIVNNRPSVWGDFAMSLIHRSGELAQMQVVEIGEKPDHGVDPSSWPDSYGYKVMLWRKGNETAFSGEFTVADAKRSGLWLNTRKKPWIYYPKDMLFNRARSRAANRGFADALHGLGIVEEERDIAEPTEPKKLASLLDDEAPAEQVEAEIEDAEIEEIEE